MTQASRHHGATGKEVLFELFASAYVIFVVLFFWGKPIVALFVLATGIVLQLIYWKSPLANAVMAIAALLGAPSEILCIKFGLWSYRAPGLVFGIPVWLPLVWAYLICLFHRISLTGYNVLQGRVFDPHDRWRRLLYFLLGTLITMYFIATMLLIAKPIAITFALFMIVVARFKHGRKDILLFIVGAILGTLGEFICMQLGFWHYHHPRLRSIGLPLSLPLAWGLSSVMIVGLAEKWHASMQKKKEYEKDH